MFAHTGSPTSNPGSMLFFTLNLYTNSAKIAYKLEKIVKPILLKSQYDGKVKVIVRPQVQPWHVSSTITHEAGLAVSV